MHVWSQARKAIDRLFDAFDRDASHDLSTRELGKALHDELGLSAKAEDTIALLQARHVGDCCGGASGRLLLWWRAVHLIHAPPVAPSP